MINTNFDFKNFIISKGFKKMDDFKFKYTLKEGFNLYLEIIKDEYVIPFTPEHRFCGKIPQKIEQAEKEFKTISEELGIKFIK